MNESPGFKCPFCRSTDFEVVDNGEICWGNNDQGITTETIHCLNCGKSFFSNSRVEVIFRELDLRLSCPYCGECNDVSINDDEDPNVHWFYCHDCKKEFAVHPEQWYERLIQ